MNGGLRIQTLAALFVVGLLAQGCGGRHEADTPPASVESRSKKSAKTNRAEDAACAAEQERKNAPAPTRSDKVGIYFSCMTTMGRQDQALYLFEREVPLDQQSDEGRIFVAVSEYLKGPDRREFGEGYLTAIAARVEDVLNSVVVDGGNVTLDFSSGIERHIPGTSTAGEVLIRELKVLASQFPQLNSLDLLIEGDCDRFWRHLEMTCKTISL